MRLELLTQTQVARAPCQMPGACLKMTTRRNGEMATRRSVDLKTALLKT